MEFLLIILVAALIFWVLTSAAKARDASGESSGCCGGGCQTDSSSDCGSSDCGSGDCGGGD